MKKIDLETKLGALFAFIAIIAVVIEMAMDGFSKAAIVGGIKDISGTVVVIIILFTTWIALHPKKDRNFVFDDALNTALNDWLKSHANMISTKGDQRDMYMYTDVANFFDAAHGKNAGRFAKIDITDKIVITFSLNRGLIVGHGEADEIAKEQIRKVGDMITVYCKSVFSEIADTRYIPSQSNIVSTFHEVTKSQKDIDNIIAMLDRVYQAFLVCASVKA